MEALALGYTRIKGAPRTQPRGVEFESAISAGLLLSKQSAKDRNANGASHRKNANKGMSHSHLSDGRDNEARPRKRARALSGCGCGADARRGRHRRKSGRTGRRASPASVFIYRNDKCHRGKRGVFRGVFASLRSACRIGAARGPDSGAEWCADLGDTLRRALTLLRGENQQPFPPRLIPARLRHGFCICMHVNIIHFFAAPQPPLTAAPRPTQGHACRWMGANQGVAARSFPRASLILARSAAKICSICQFRKLHAAFIFSNLFILINTVSLTSRSC